MLQIRLSKPASESTASVKPVPVDTVTVACPEHLVLADLPVAKSLGPPCSAAVIKTVGRRSRRQLGERVHFCVRCDFPIAIYGRLSPCEHVFCLDCARSDSLCYLCDYRVHKIQTIKMMEGIFICAAPHCLKSFLKKTEFESHIHGAHTDLLNPNRAKDVNESETISTRKSSASETTVQRPLNRDQPSSGPIMQPRPVLNFSAQGPNQPAEHHPDSSNQLHGFDRSATQNRFRQQTFDSQGQGGLCQDSAAPLQFVLPPYASDGGHKFFGAPYEMARPDSTKESGPGQGSLLGYPPGPTGPITFPPNYPQPWSTGPGTVPLEPPLVTQGPTDGFPNIDPQGRGFFQGDYGQNVGLMPLNVIQPAADKGVQILAAQPMGLPLPPPHVAQMQRGRSYSGDGNNSSHNNHDVSTPGFGWHET